MNVSILLPDLRGGGVERIRLVLAEEFARRGHDVEFVLMQARGELLDEAQARFAVHSLNCDRLRQVPLALARYLRARRPDAVLAAMWPLTGIAGLAMRLSGHRACLVASEHTDFRKMPALKGYERFALRHFGRQLYGPCDSIVAVSGGVADSLRAVAGLPTDWVTVINNPVRALPNGEISADDRTELAGWLAGDARLIAIGALKPAKGFDVLLRALAELRQRVDARLLVLGEGPLRGDLEALASELGVADHVRFPGFRADPGAFLAHADVFVMSSNWEGFGNVILEALAAGVPVVSTDCLSGPAEILGHGRYGRLVPVGDPAALAEAVEDTLRAPRDPAPLIARAAEFSPQVIAGRYLGLLGAGPA